MPNRIIREAILSSEKIASLGWAEEVFFRRLMSIVDDYGRYEANLQLLRSRCYPLQTDSVSAGDVLKWLEACQRAGVLACYTVDGKSYVEVLRFQQQQRSASKFPPNPAPDGTCNHLLADAHLGVSVVEGVSVVVKEPTVLVVSAPAEPPAGAVVKQLRIPCPGAQLLEAFHEECPTLPRVMKLNDKRRTHLASRWREVDADSKFSSAEDGIEVFRSIFRKVSSSDFLSGRAKDWRASFDWLTESSTNFLKVCEGHYDNDRRAAK